MTVEPQIGIKVKVKHLGEMRYYWGKVGSIVDMAFDGSWCQVKLNSGRIVFFDTYCLEETRAS